MIEKCNVDSARLQRAPGLPPIGRASDSLDATGQIADGPQR